MTSPLTTGQHYLGKRSIARCALAGQRREPTTAQNGDYGDPRVRTRLPVSRLSSHAHQRFFTSPSAHHELLFSHAHQ